MRSLNILICMGIMSLFPSTSFSQSLDYYLPEQTTYDPSFPTPQQLLSYEVGEWHVSHDQLVSYMKEIARLSPRAKLVEIGRTYENRPLIHLIFTSPENHERLEDIRQEHVQLTDPSSSSADPSKSKAVVWLGYSIHGNEPSGSNSSLLTAYHLAAAQGEEIEAQLNDMVIIVDPCFNPDGLHRFSSWVNSNRGINVSITDPDSREFSEPWPRGRTNHFWFDLNRDWLPAQLPESQARLKAFHHWKPNYLTDHHEMGSYSTFFFQPGVPSRNHPITPKKVIELAGEMASYYSEALDDIGSLYYSQEGYDDFYYGKGSTYPDVNGAIGILFEQASSRGHAQETQHGILTFPFTIRNQFNASLATLKGTHELKDQLLTFQQNFFTSALELSDKDPVKAYVFDSKEDPLRAIKLLEILDRHTISTYALRKDITVKGEQFEAESSFIVPLKQPQYRLIQGIFEKRTSFEDSLFYDISAWTFPLAFNLNYQSLGRADWDPSILGEEISEIPSIGGEVIGGKSSYAYLFEWQPYLAPAFMYQLQKAGLRTKVATKPFQGPGDQIFTYGTIMIPVVGQALSADELYSLLSDLAPSYGVNVYRANTGFNSIGIDLGSRDFLSVEKPAVCLITGDGVRSYDAGEIWHLLDQRMGIPVSMVDIREVRRTDLSKYNTIVLASGSYTNLGSSGTVKLEEWVRTGGKLVAMRDALNWLAASKMIQLKFRDAFPNRDLKEGAILPYANRSNERGAFVTGGAIFKATMDLTNPLAYGYSKPEISLFRNTNRYLDLTGSPYDQPVRYVEEPLLSGYIHKAHLPQLSGSAAVQVSSYGAGKVIAFTDNHNFRAFWYGTNKLFMNALFFGGIL